MYMSSIKIHKLSLKFFILVLALTFHYSLFTIHCFSQSVGINISGNNPNSKALLDIDATGMSNKAGLLLPRITTAERNSITSPIPESLLIYNTDNHCFEAYFNGNWIDWGCLRTGCKVPAQPGPITGTTQICKGVISDIGVSYSVANVPGVSYTWNYSGSGFSIESNGNYGNLIIADYTVGATAGILSVTPSDSCGSGIPQTLAIKISTPLNPPTCGSQTWAASNLNVGTQVSQSTIQIIGQKWCYGDIAANCNIYGGLYQWSTIMNGSASANCDPCGPTTGHGGVQGICPSGYHIPSDLEWSRYEYCVENNIYPVGNTSLATFQNAMGMAGSTTPGVGPGDKLRITPCDLPTWSYTTGNNASGFTALPGGISLGGNSMNISQTAYFWTSTEATAGLYAYMRQIGNFIYDSQIYRWDNNEPYGQSARCLKD